MKKYNLDEVKEGSKYINMKYSLKDKVRKRLTRFFHDNR